MIDVEQLLLRYNGSDDKRPPLLAAPYELSKELCQKLIAKGLISGYISDQKPAASNPHVRGWWEDRTRHTWTIRRGQYDSLVFLGAESQVGGRMLVEALSSGIRRLWVTDADSAGFHAMPLHRSVLRRLLDALASGSLRHRITNHGKSYEDAFQELFSQIGDSLRLPREVFVPRRAALILGSLGPGGAERQAALTAAGLKSHGAWEPVIGCNHLDGAGSFHLEFVRSQALPIQQIPLTPPQFDTELFREILHWSLRYTHLGFQNIVHVILSYAAFLTEVKPSLVQTWMDYSNVLAGIAADLIGVPALVLSGRSVAPDNFSIFQPYMKPGYLALLQRRSATFTNNSAAGAADYGRWLDLPSDRFAVIHNGFDFPDEECDDKPQELRRQLAIPKDAPVVGSVLRFSEEKQPYLWINVARELIAEDPRRRFVMFGSGVMLEEVRNFVRDHSLAEWIKLPGVTSDVWTALSIMDVFLLTSRMEGLPNVLIEAQGMGVPVVATGFGGMSETYRSGTTGLTADPPTLEGLTIAVRRLLNDDQLRQSYADAARRFARDQFGIDHMINSTIEAFDDAMRRGQAQQRNIGLHNGNNE
jgi:glycosyltransferase involved in cell wall biosynthesis